MVGSGLTTLSKEYRVYCIVPLKLSKLTFLANLQHFWLTEDFIGISIKYDKNHANAKYKSTAQSTVANGGDKITLRSSAISINQIIYIHIYLLQ